jgi:signal transduction histidine kinase
MVKTDDRASARQIGVYALGALGAAVLVAELLHPLASNAVGLRSAVETASALLAALVAGLVAVRFRHTGSLRDAIMFAALCAIALLGLTAYALPKAIGVDSGGQLVAAPQVGALFIAAAIAAIAFSPRARPARVVAGGLTFWASLGLAAATLSGLAGIAFASAFPGSPGNAAQGLDVALSHPLALGVAIIATSLFAGAALRFAREADAGPTRSALLQAGGCVLLLAAQLDYVSLPAAEPNAVGPRQGLMLLWLVLMLVDAVIEDLALRRSLTAQAARQAVLRERQRMSCDLHDGLAQDLAFIAAYGERLARAGETEHPVAIAARRALQASRGIVVDLAASEAPTLRSALVQVGDELSARFAIRIEVEADEVELDQHARDEVVRIAREAIANAARHGHAGRVLVSVSRAGRGVRLSVRDDGEGIENRALSSGGGFGLGMMRSRAAALGGRLSARKTGERGSELEVLLP